MTVARLLFALIALPALAQEDLKQAPTILDKPHERGVGKALPPGSALAPLLEDAKAVVVLFTAADCPVSRLYKPKLDRLEKDYLPRGVKFLTVPTGDAALVQLLDARRTPEAFVLDGKGVLRYRGAVDDQYGIGYARDQATKNYLTDALEAVLAGKAPPVPATEAAG